MLKNKIEKSKEILKQSFNKWGSDMCIPCNFGKESSVMLHLTNELYGEVPMPILFIDTHQHFAEVYSFKEELSRLWNLKIISVTPKKTYNEVKGDKNRCCYWLRTEPFLRAMEEHQWKACCITAPSENNPANYRDKHIIKREAENFYRVYPMLYWSERDTWQYIRIFNLPYCSLYDKGYRSVGCMKCTTPILQIESKKREEALDKDEIIKRLRELGYF